MSDLIVLEQLTPATVFKEGGGDPVIEQIKQEVLSVDRDISTEEGRKNVASLAYKVARSKTLLDEMGKTFAADLKKQTKAIDNERARIWDALEALQKQVRQPLTEFEDAETSRIQEHEGTLLKIESSAIFDGIPLPPHKFRIDCQRFPATCSAIGKSLENAPQIRLTASPPIFRSSLPSDKSMKTNKLN